MNTLGYFLVKEIPAEKNYFFVLLKKDTFALIVVRELKFIVFKSMTTRNVAFTETTVR